jgi:hypothetical protein
VTVLVDTLEHIMGNRDPADPVVEAELALILREREVPVELGLPLCGGHSYEFHYIIAREKKINCIAR